MRCAVWLSFAWLVLLGLGAQASGATSAARSAPSRAALPTGQPTTWLEICFSDAGDSAADAARKEKRLLDTSVFFPSSTLLCSAPRLRVVATQRADLAHARRQKALQTWLIRGPPGFVTTAWV